MQCVLSCMKNTFFIQIICNKNNCLHCAMKLLTALCLQNDLWACRAHELIKNKLWCIKQILTNLHDSGWPCIDMLNRHVCVWLSSSTLQKHIVNRNLWHPSQGTSTNVHWSIWKQPPISGYRIVLVLRIINTANTTEYGIVMFLKCKYRLSTKVPVLWTRPECTVYCS